MTTTIGTTGRLDVWRDLIREHFVALDIDSTAEPHFAGAVTTTDVGHLRVARVTSRTQACRRTPGLARRDDAVFLQVGLLTQGAAQLSQDGREAAMRPGDFALYETDRPFLWRLADDWELLVFTWPRQTVALDVAESVRLTARALPGDAGLGGIVGRMLRGLVADPPALTSPGAVQLAYEVGELVTTAATEQVRDERPTAAAEGLLRDIDAYIAAHLTDPALSPSTVAGAHFMSTRQLHRLFAQRGDTVAHHIRQQRLERCRHDLVNPRTAELSITHIAHRWGFTDLPGFSRAFRAAFGTTPSAYRRSAADGWGRGDWSASRVSSVGSDPVA